MDTVEETVYFTIVSDSNSGITDQQDLSYIETPGTKKVMYLLDQHKNLLLGQEQEENEICSTDVVLNDTVLKIEENSEIEYVTLQDEQMFMRDYTILDNMDGDYRKIQLDDGTCAFIDKNMWYLLLQNTETPDDIITCSDASENGRIILNKRQKKYQCCYYGCNKMYTTAHHLTVHVRTHTGSRPYQCKMDGCEKSFATGYSLKAHLRTHTGETPYLCGACPKKFKTSGDLQKHIRTHTGEKPFKCPIDGCNRFFTTSNIRKVHVRSHTGERPFSCTYKDCGKAFASATNFKNHMRIHSGEKPYACQVQNCGKKFTEYSSLFKHKAVHETNKCEYCVQVFKHASILKSHKELQHNILTTGDGTEIHIANENSW